MEKSKVTELIGDHPSSAKDIFSTWLKNTDKSPSMDKKYRILEEDAKVRAKAISGLAQFLIIHHVPGYKLANIKKKEKILTKYKYNEYVKKLNLLPTSDKTKKGNFTEILLAEYLCSTSGCKNLVYRLHYNPNVDQSMKGDDVLLFDVNNIKDKIIVGEAKYRSSPTKEVIQQIVNSFEGNNKYPISLTFIANRLYEYGKKKLSEQIEEIITSLYKSNTRIINVGFLLSSSNTSKYIEEHLHSENRNFVMLSLGIDNPSELVEKAYKLSTKKMANTK